MILVYVFCSSGLHVRAVYVFLYIMSTVLLWLIIVIMLNFELWTEILFAFIPADFLMNKLVVMATMTRDRLLYLQITAMIYCALLESVRFLSVLGIIDEEMGYTWNFAKFAAVDLFCTFLSKSEIAYFINNNSDFLGKFSNTKLLVARITRACVNVTTLSWPIWNAGFEIGLFILEEDHN